MGGLVNGVWRKIVSSHMGRTGLSGRVEKGPLSREPKRKVHGPNPRVNDPPTTRPTPLPQRVFGGTSSPWNRCFRGDVRLKHSPHGTE